MKYNVFFHVNIQTFIRHNTLGVESGYTVYKGIIHVYIQRLTLKEFQINCC